MTNRFLFMADAHIKSRTWTNNLQLTGDAYAALSVISEHQLKDRIQTLVIGGDWFDSTRPAARDIIQTVWFITQFTNVYHISGNHDNNAPSFLDALGSADIAGTKIIHLTDTPIKLPDTNAWLCGVDWMSSADALQNVVADICSTWVKEHPATDVLYIVLHTSFQHLLPFDGAYKLSAEFIKELIGAHQVRVLVGDIHTRDTTQLTYPGQYIHSPGSLYPLSFDKTADPTFVSIIDAMSGTIADMCTTVRRYATIEYNPDETLDAQVKNALQGSDNDTLAPFVRVVVPDSADVRVDTSKVTDAIVQVVRASSPVSGDSVPLSADGVSLLDAVLDELGDDAFTKQLAEALLSADDPLEEVQSWLDFWKVKQTT